MKCPHYLEDRHFCKVSEEEAFLWCKVPDEYKKCFRFRRQQKREQQYLNKYLDFP
jgi:hypothetical protein